MPAASVHLAYAADFLRRHDWPEADQGAFLRGSVYPDIRHLAGLERGRTHWPHQTTLADVKAEPNPWRAGVLFHNWTDDAWNQYFQQLGMLGGEFENDLTMMALKIMEDSRIRDRLVDVPGIARQLLQVVLGESREYGTDDSVTAQWYWAVVVQLENGLASEPWRTFAKQQGILNTNRILELRSRIEALRQAGGWEARLDESWVVITRLLDRELATREVHLA